MTNRWREVYILSAMRAVSFAGDFAAATAITLYLQAGDHSSAFIVATLIASTAPAVALVSVTGWVSDRFDSRTIFLSTAGAQALICLIMAFWLNPYAVVGLTALLSAGIAFTHPVFGGLPRSMVEKDQVARAASISQTSAMAGMLAAPAIGGFLAGTVGTRWALLLDAASFVVVGVGALLIKTRLHAARTGAQQNADEPVVNYSVWRDPFLRPLLVATGLVITSVSITNVVAVFFVRETLGGSKEVYGIVESAWMAGLILGSIVVGRNKRLSSSAQMVMAFACMGLALLFSAFVPSVWWLVPVNILGGIGNGTMATNLHVILNLNVPDAFRGRAFAALGAVSNAAPLIGYALGGFLIAAASPRVSYFVIGVTACVCTLVVTPALRRGSPTDVHSETVEPSRP